MTAPGVVVNAASTSGLNHEVLSKLNLLLDTVKDNNKQIGKVRKQLGRLENRLADLYEFTSLPLIATQFGSDFAESVDFGSAAHIVDHLLQLAYNLDLAALQKREFLIEKLEQTVLFERQGLRAAMKSLLNEACELGSCSMVTIPRDFVNSPWDDVRATLEEVRAGMGPAPSSASLERFANLQRLIDALDTGRPPRPLPGFTEMATALACGQCVSKISLDCRGRIDMRDTYVEFHLGAFKGFTEGLPETRAHLRQAASVLAWAFKVLEPYVQHGKDRDLEAIGYCFSVGKSAMTEPLKLSDEVSFDHAGRRREADIAYRYFSVKPTGLHERYARE